MRTSREPSNNSSTRLRAMARWWLVANALLFGLAVVPDAQIAADEYRLKAAFVYRFPQFVEWPAASVADAKVLELCVFHPNPFGSDLEQLVTGETVRGLPLRVRIVAEPNGLVGCHVVFVGARSGTAAPILKALANRPVLTVGESDRFLDDGGVILLKVVDRRVRFEVHTENARRAGLRVDAQLLSLAAAVRGAAR